MIIKSPLRNNFNTYEFGRILQCIAIVIWRQKPQILHGYSVGNNCQVQPQPQLQLQSYRLNLRGNKKICQQQKGKRRNQELEKKEKMYLCIPRYLTYLQLYLGSIIIPDRDQAIAGNARKDLHRWNHETCLQEIYDKIIG